MSAQRPAAADVVLILYPRCQLASASWLQGLFRITSDKICWSSVRSATTRFSRAFSSRSRRISRTSATPRLP